MPGPGARLCCAAGDYSKKEELWLTSPVRDLGWKEFSVKGFCLNYSLRSFASPSASLPLQERRRDGSEEAFLLPLLRLLLIDRLEIQKKRKGKKCFTTLFYLLFAEGRAVRQAERPSSAALRRCAASRGLA